MPISVKNAQYTRFDGPPRVIVLGFQMKNGKMTKPVDIFDDPAFDQTRIEAQHITDYLCRHGAFEPYRLPMEDIWSIPPYQM